MSNRKAIYCDCCGKELMAEWVDGKIVIRRLRNGRAHVVVINISGSHRGDEPEEPATTGRDSDRSATMKTDD